MQAAQQLAAQEAGGGGEASVVFAAQCYHHDGGADAMFMLQAHVTVRAAPGAVTRRSHVPV